MNMKKITCAWLWLSLVSFSVSAASVNKPTATTPKTAVKSKTCTHARDDNNIQICTALADSGNAVAQNTLGEIYYGNNLLYQKGDHTKARLLFEKAAAQGNVDAQNSIGYIYENASGGKPPRLYVFDEHGKNIDPELPKIEAQFAPFDKFSIPIENYPRTIYPLSEYGQGVEPDLNKAFEWYEKAAKQGHALAQTNLAYFYLFGIVVKKDEKQAFKLYEQAAKQQFVPALKTLAFMYMQGLGTKVDDIKPLLY